MSPRCDNESVDATEAAGRVDSGSDFDITIKKLLTMKAIADKFENEPHCNCVQIGEKLYTRTYLSSVKFCQQVDFFLTLLFLCFTQSSS